MAHIASFRIPAVLFTFAAVTATYAPADSITGPACALAAEGIVVPDELGRRLANRFAPILLYAADEPNLPASVDDYLKKTRLSFYSAYCQPRQTFAAALNDALRSNLSLPGCRDAGEMVYARGTRSTNKASTFYLKNVSSSEWRGTSDSTRWITYCHAYRNDAGGVTLQYWRFYAYNTAILLGFRIDSASHGGDWEAIHVVLNSTLRPIKIRLLGHTQIETRSWSDVATVGDHPVIRCEKGSHTSHLATTRDVGKRRQFIEYRTWTGGEVRWPQGQSSPCGGLVLMGQKTCPGPGLEWIQYAGLWGTREASGLFAYYRSGYWGPAFNETGMRRDGFISAWCEGILQPATPGARSAVRRECYPDRIIQ